MTDNLFQRAERYRYTREFNQAVPLYEKVVLLEPKRQGYVAYIYLAFLHDYARALHHFNAYDAQTPNFDDIEGNSPVSFYQGIIFLKTGEFSAAIDQFDKAIGYIEMKHGADWVNYRYYINRAMGFLAINQPEKALTDLDKALKNYRQSPLAYFYRGRALQQLGRAAEAKAAFMDAQFFFRANRADAIRVNQSLMPEDQYFPLHEPEIEEALAILNK
jgi:tetratricopeptide (TPR) repeat protein